jgi:hypothetical protein
VAPRFAAEIREQNERCRSVDERDRSDNDSKTDNEVSALADAAIPLRSA